MDKISIREFYTKLRAGLNREQRKVSIKMYLEESRDARGNVKWQYDTYPEETQEVLAEVGLFYNVEKDSVERIRKKKWRRSRED